MRRYLARAGYAGDAANLGEDVFTAAREVYRIGATCTAPFVAAAMLVALRAPDHLIPKELEGCARVSLFCVSLGGAIDERTALFFERDDPLRGALLDAWGSEAVERLAETVDERLRRRYGPGTMRFSPGYGDLDVRQNGLVLRIIAAASQMTLEEMPMAADAETGILRPRKSVVCMIGWTGVS